MESGRWEAGVTLAWLSLGLTPMSEPGPADPTYCWWSRHTRCLVFLRAAMAWVPWPLGRHTPSFLVGVSFNPQGPQDPHKCAFFPSCPALVHDPPKSTEVQNVTEWGQDHMACPAPHTPVSYSILHPSPVELARGLFVLFLFIFRSSMKHFQLVLFSFIMSSQKCSWVWTFQTHTTISEIQPWNCRGSNIFHVIPYLIFQ